MKKAWFALALLTCFCLPAVPFAQVVNATLFGTISDATGALIPGVRVTAENINTGITSTTLSNEAGTYRFPSLQPGPYKVSAELPGFQTQAFQLDLGTSEQIRQNFSLQVGPVTQSVEVTTASDELQSTVQSVGDVLSVGEVQALPLVGRDVLDFVQVIPGVVGNGGPATTFAGIPAGGAANVIIQRDGVTVNDGRHNQVNGVFGSTRLSPDLVEEIRVVVAAVDVESGGSAQVVLRTRSGTNQYHGALAWAYQTSALNSNTWSNNRLGIDKIWFNRHQYTARLGGPIIRNRTFFFALFDGQNALQKDTVNTMVLTDMARQGIFRFFPGVNNGNVDATVSGTGTATAIAPVVDALGNPRDYTQIPGATGPMQSFSVYGDALNPGDPNRTGLDPTGFMQRLLDNMPRANAFDGNLGDGLNTATHRWVRRTVGSNVGTIAGAADENFNRKQFNLKVDHQLNTNHKLTGSWVLENNWTDAEGLPAFPNGWGGEILREPRVASAQLTSTLSPNVVNEARFGYRRTWHRTLPGYHHREHGEEAWNFMTVISDIPIMQHPVLFTNHMINCSGGCSQFGNRTFLYEYSDSLSWTRGEHGFKFGGTFRFNGGPNGAPIDVIPHVYGGAGDAPVRGIDMVGGMLPANITLAQNILLSLSGSVERIQQRFETREPGDPQFLDFRDNYFHPDNPEGMSGKVKSWYQNEINFFIKDDWRISPSLTLNLGIRYDLMRVPYMVSASGKGFTAGLEGGSAAAFGISGRGYDNWFSKQMLAAPTRTIIIGPDSSNPGQGIWPSDRNNWGPAVGFAWSPNFWGQDKTTIRGGYQVSYQLPGNALSNVDNDIANLPGFIFSPVDRGDGSFRNFDNMVIPVPVSQQPLEVVPITERSQNISVFAPDYITPYVQTFTFGVTRSLARNLTLDARYVGTRGTKLHSSVNLNLRDFRNNGLLEALTVTRAGGNHPLFDQMLNGLNIGSGVVGVAVTGSEALRRHSQTRTNIANGNFAAVAEFLNTSNAGTMQPRGQVIAGGLLRSSGLFPENFIVTNPQFANVNYRNNSNSSNYHSLQMQVTLRPVHGFSYQGTYTWSRSLATLDGHRDPVNMRADYTLQNSHRTHDFRSHGNFELPFGPGKLLAGNSSGWLGRLVEGWQLGAIFNMTSGAPLNIAGQTTLYAAGTPDIVGDFPRNGEVAWPLIGGNAFGNFFSEQYQRVRDPACDLVATNLRTWCTNTALADSSGNIVLRNAAPGELGTLGLRTIEGPGRWDVDMDLQKSFQIDETRKMTIRVDALNVFNHPTPGNPNLSINSGTFGEVNTKTGSRAVQMQLRLDF